jgi:putative transposase
MQRLQSFRFALVPSEKQRDMRRFAGACRFVVNKALALQQQRHEQGQKNVGYTGLCRLLIGWRHSAETPWLNDAPIPPLQQSPKGLERAYVNFFAGRA